MKQRCRERKERGKPRQANRNYDEAMHKSCVINCNIGV